MKSPIRGYMEIYVIQPGDDIGTIANSYGITVEKLVSDNGILNPKSLVVGQAIVILYPKETYTVKQGDSLSSIADTNGITIMQLIRNNPFLYDREYIYPDETLVLSYNTVKDIQVNGFTYVFVNKDILIRTLPYLTYISVFNYRITENASIVIYGDDTEIISLAELYDTIPLLMISTFSPQGEFNVEFIYELLLVNEKQEKLINEMLQIIKTKGFKGINFLVDNITEYNEELYLKFFSKLSSTLRNDGYTFMITVSPDFNTINKLIDYKSISYLVDRIIFLKNVWELNKQPPSPISNISLIRPFIDYVTSIVSSKYISLGKPLIGCDWELPFDPNISRAKVMSLNATLTLAYDINTTIQLDDVSKTPYYDYKIHSVGDSQNHRVWFIDARSIKALDDIIIEYDLVGTGLWHLSSYNQQLYSIINSRFNIIKKQK